MSEAYVQSAAAFIAARLQYNNPPCNDENPWVSTISIDQHKTKFGFACVYCQLASDELVKKKWRWLKIRQERIESGEKIYGVRIDPSLLASDELTEEFRKRCLLTDARHYRNVYMDMVGLRPDLRSQICSHADYSELLYGDYDEIVRTIDKKADDGYQVQLQGLMNRYSVSSVESFKQFMKTVYEPTSRELLAMRD